jgi:uncharacterized membrane protein
MGDLERGEKGDQGVAGRDAPVNHWAVIGYLILALAMGIALYGSWHADRAAQRAIQVNCNFGNENRRIIRLILEDANKRTQTSNQRTPEEKREAAKFYGQYLRELEAFDCDALK